jgi:P-type Ca2+ transporter type 2C
MRNYFFIVINIIMVGGQVLIIFVGNQAFKIVPLDGKEWGISIGLGAISIPWGAFIRKIPDEWVGALVPKRFRSASKVPKTLAELEAEKLGKDSDEFAPPLRVMTTLRGPRARHNSVGFRAKMYEKKERVKNKAKDKLNAGVKGESTTELKNGSTAETKKL